MNIKIKDLPHFDRPREKLIKKGKKSLKNEELLAILLRTGIRQKSALSLAREILKRYNLKNLSKITFKELSNIYGVGKTKALQIIAAIELGERIFKKSKQKEIYIKSISDILKEINFIKDNKKEHFIALYLNARNKLIKKETISIGTINASLVHPREVFEPAIKNLSVSIILAHNHPSGDPSPSEDDIKITKRLKESGRILGIEILDHIIISKSEYFSFREKGLF